MRSLSLLGWMAFVAVGSKGDMGPFAQQNACRQAEADYSGPPMPRVSRATFSGSGCPSSESRILYNYQGRWSCHTAYDVSFLIPGLRARAEDGDVEKLECAVTFLVDQLGKGYQVALNDGNFRINSDLSPLTMVRAIGEVIWERGAHAVSPS